MHPKTAEMAFQLASDRIDTQDEYLIEMAEQRPEVLFCAAREVWLEALRSPNDKPL
jgi:hypothetical protein